MPSVKLLVSFRLIVATFADFLPQGGSRIHDVQGSAGVKFFFKQLVKVMAVFGPSFQCPSDIMPH